MNSLLFSGSLKTVLIFQNSADCWSNKITTWSPPATGVCSNNDPVLVYNVIKDMQLSCYTCYHSLVVELHKKEWVHQKTWVCCNSSRKLFISSTSPLMHQGEIISSRSKTWRVAQVVNSMVSLSCSERWSSLLVLTHSNSESGWFLSYCVSSRHVTPVGNRTEDHRMHFLGTTHLIRILHIWMQIQVFSLSIYMQA